MAVAKQKKAKPKLEKLTCPCCATEKKLDGFYMSYNPLHLTGRLPYCKDCLRSMTVDDKGNLNSDKFKDMLKVIDRPFIYEIFKISVANSSDTVGMYIKNTSLMQYRDLGWKDSILEPVLEVEIKPEEIEISNDDVSQELKLKWGDTYKSIDYIRLEKFYNDMKRDNRIETAQDESYLIKLSKISIKLDRALEEDDYDTAKKLGDLFSKYMADSQFRAMDKSDASKTGGVRTFSQIYAEVEKEDFIPPWEYYRKLKDITQDFVDKTIMYILNYTLKLNKVSQLTEPPIDTPKLEEVGE